MADLDISLTEPDLKIDIESSLPLASDVREGVDRGDGVLGTLRDFSQPNLGDSVVDFSESSKCWTVKQDLTGSTVTLILFGFCDPKTVHGQIQAVVDGSKVTVVLDQSALTDLVFCGCPPVAEIGFALVASDSGGMTQLHSGRAYVHGRPEVDP